MRKPTTAEWMGAAFIVALAMVLVIRLVAAPGQRLDTALRVTARWSFFWFWLATTGSALATLFGSRFRALPPRARDFGLSFAAAHLVHVGLVAWLLYRSETPFPQSVPVFFGIGVLWVYLLALLSVRRVSAMLGARVCRVVRTIGVEYLSLVFLVDFAKNPFDSGPGHLVAYLPFLALTIAGPVLRFAAAIKRLAQSRNLATS